MVILHQPVVKIFTLSVLGWVSHFDSGVSFIVFSRKVKTVVFELNFFIRYMYIRLAGTQTKTAVSEHVSETGHYPIWKEVKLINQESDWYARRAKEAIHITLQPNNINKDSGIEIPEMWMPTIQKHNNRKIWLQQTAEGTATHLNNGKCEDRNAPITADLCDGNDMRRSQTIS